MKILKYLLALIAVAAVGFMLLGVFKPAISYGNEIEVNKPLNESWAVMMDHSKDQQWLTGMKSKKIISGEEDAVGSKYKIVWEEDGHSTEMTEEITAIKPEEQMSMTFSMDFMNQDFNIFFSEKDGKTILRTDAVAKGNGMFAKSMLALNSSMMTEQDLIMINNLKKVIEENTTNYFPEPEPVAETVEEMSEAAAKE